MPGNPENLEQFEIGLILAGAVNPANVRRQLSLRVSAGRMIRLPRGLYSLAAPYRQTPPRPFLVANSLLPGFYVACNLHWLIMD